MPLPATSSSYLPAEAFKDTESYAATKAHELIHWTGSAGRCAREFGKRAIFSVAAHPQRAADYLHSLQAS